MVALRLGFSVGSRSKKLGVPLLDLPYGPKIGLKLEIWSFKMGGTFYGAGIRKTSHTILIMRVSFCFLLYFGQTLVYTLWVQIYALNQ